MDVPQDSKIASRLLRRIQARNHELIVEILIEAALGILFTLLTSVAGLAAVLMGGPMNLVGALRNWLHRLPTDPRLIDQAAEILSACQPEVDLKKIRSSGAAAVLLRRLNLIVPRVDSTVVTLTDKGRDVVGQNRANPGQP